MRIGLLAARMEVYGGVEMVVVRTARHLRSRGHTPVVVSTAFHAEVARMLDADGTERRAIGAPEQTDRLRALGGLREAAAAALRDCDALNVHNFPANLWVDGDTPRPTVYACHEPPRHLHETVMNPVFLRSRFNTRPWYTRTWDGWMNARWRALDIAATRRMRRILTNSRYTAARIEEIYGFSALPCYFSPEPPHPVPPPLPTEGFRMLFVGRLTPMKNLETAVEAVARLPAEIGARLHVVGEGDQRARLEALAQRRGAADRVIFRGGLPDDALAREYAEAKVILYIPFDEPMGLVPMEGGLRGIPTVASDHGGPAEIVLHERTGLLVDALDPDAVAAALLRFAHDEDLRTRCGAAAAQRITEDLRFELYAHSLETMMGIAASARPEGA